MTVGANLPTVARSVEHAAERHVWQVKVSSFCNLRCRYCYEWDRLTNRFRMPLAVWSGLFARIRQAVDRTDGRQTQSLVWHGGEPTLLPVSYVDEVLDLQTREIGDLLDVGVVQNAVQTNLYSWNRTIDRMGDAGFHFSVSCDYSPGARDTPGGGDAEARVWQNLAALLKQDTLAGVLLVLGRHNHAHLIEAHDAIEALGARWLRIVTAFDPENAAPVGDLLLAPDEASACLFDLWQHRLGRRSGMAVVPVDGVQDMILRLSSGRAWAGPRRVRTRVQMDGRSETTPTDAYIDRICGDCRFQRACDKSWLNAMPPLPHGPCPVGSQLLDRVAGHLE